MYLKGTWLYTKQKHFEHHTWQMNAYIQIMVLIARQPITMIIINETTWT